MAHARHHRDHVARRPRRATRVRRPGRRLRRAGVRRDGAGVRAARPLDRRLLRARRVRRRPVPRRARGRPRRRARAAPARQPARRPAPGCSSPSSSGARRPTTARSCPTPTSTRSPAAPRSPRSSRRPSSPPASPTPTPDGSIDAGVTVAIASNCNPGSSYTTSMPFCIALAVREMGMTVDEAVWAATAGGAAALRRDDVGTADARVARRPRASSTRRRRSTSCTAPACRAIAADAGRRATSSVAGMSERVVERGTLVAVTRSTRCPTGSSQDAVALSPMLAVYVGLPSDGALDDLSPDGGRRPGRAGARHARRGATPRPCRDRRRAGGPRRARRAPAARTSTATTPATCTRR